MPDLSPKLSLPFIQPAQAQKHVTHNEALRALDVIAQLNVIADDVLFPPGGAAEGDSYIVPAGGLGDWAGHGGEVATLQDGAWQFVVPQAGWRAYVTGRAALVVHDGASWADFTLSELQNLARLGLGTQATAANPFSAKLNAALWTALTAGEGGSGDMMLTANKEVAGDDVGFVFQTGFVTKALVGLFGSDLLRFAVSADGGTFFDGLILDPATGIADQPQLPRFKAVTNYDNYAAAGVWVTVGINSAEYNAQGAFDAGTNRFTAPVDGTYLLGASLTYKQDAAATALRGRLLQNGAVQIAGSYGELAGILSSEHSTLWLQSMAALSAGDTVELQVQFPAAGAYAMADNTAFWGCKIG